MNKYAVIDLGTNTFNLLVVETRKGNVFVKVYNERYFVRLGEEGIQTIGANAYQRGLEAMQCFANSLMQFDLVDIKALGTAALRSATNGQKFVEDVAKKTGIEINLISGDTEAEYIYKGVKMALNLRHRPDIIMDIGGGSVEFIIADTQGVLWQKSYPIGLSVLYRSFHKHEPITKEELASTYNFIRNTLSTDFKAAIENFKPQFLIGATGSFDVLIELSKHQNNIEDHITGDSFRYWLSKLVPLSKEGREAIPYFPSNRSDMIIMALSLIDVAFQYTEMDEMIVSPYALKEGVLCEMINIAK